MFTLLTPENLPATLTAVSLIITAVGGVVLYRVQKEPPKAGSQDAAALALAENTKALNAMVEGLKGQNTHFADNNEMFKALGPVLGGMAKDFTEMRHDGAESRILLALIRDALNRRTR